MRGRGKSQRAGAIAAAGLLALGLVVFVPTGPSVAAAGDLARAELVNGAGARIGEVVFAQIDGRVAIRAEVTALPPGFHGFHVHDVGACTGDFTSAGGHYNPTGANHGSHRGDMPVLLARSDGSATAFSTTDAFTVRELLDADVAVIAHAAPDNYGNIPAARYTHASGSGPDASTHATGDAGARLACGAVKTGTPTLSAGYRLAGAKGGVFTFGEGAFFGSSAGASAAPFVGTAATPGDRGYRLVDQRGGVFNHGDAGFHGSAASPGITEPFVGIATPPYDAVAELVTGAGASAGWVGFEQEQGRVQVTAHAEGVAPGGFHGFHVHDVGTCAGDFTSAGGHFNPSGARHGSHTGDMPVLFAKADNKATETFTTDAFTVQQLLDSDVAVIVHAGADNYGNVPARYTSSLSGTTGPDATTNSTGDAGPRLLCGPVRGVAPGYWLAGARGGVFTFGTPGFFGSPIGVGADEPMVGIAPSPTGRGYWVAGAHGGVYAFGDAGFFGSGPASGISEPIVGIAATPTGKGYWLAGARGGVYAFGDAGFSGSGAGTGVTEPIAGIRGTGTGAGYWLLGTRGGVYTFGDARFRGSAPGIGVTEPIVGFAPIAG